MNAETSGSASSPATPDLSSSRPKPASNLKAWLLVPAGLIFLGIAAFYAFCTSSSYFSHYDDEGFMMIGVRGLLEGHPLYDDIFTYYGPFYYFHEWFLHAVVRLPLTHDATRILCILHWLAAASLLALAARVITRSTLVAFFVFAQAILHLTPLAREPGHPQELIVLLLPLAVLIAAKDMQRRWTPALLGCIGAALVFTKINAGVFFGLGLLLALSCQTPFFRKHRGLFAVWLVLFGILPCLLMRPNLGEGWARIFCGQACIAILTAGSLAWLFGGEREVTRAQWLTVGAAAIGTSVVLVSITLLTGTSPGAMVEHLIVGPSRVGSSFSVPLKAPFCSWSGLAALTGAAAVVLWRKRPEKLSSAIPLAKGLYGAIGTLLLLADYNRQLGYLLPWSWLLIVPIRGENRGAMRGEFVRIFLCLQAVWQGLQAYPIAGTQAVIATLLSILVYSICLYDAIIAFATSPRAARYQHSLTPRTVITLKCVALLGLLYVFVMNWCALPPAWRYYSTMQPLGLPGSRLIRLPPPQVELYRGLTQYLEIESDAFIAIPGMNSLYFWTRKAPPNYLNLFEVVLLNDREQEKVIADLQKARRPLILLNERAAAGAAGTGPLRRLIETQCRVLGKIGEFQILEIAPAAGK